MLDDFTYTELQEENTWLRGSLREARRGQERAERMALAFVVLFSASDAVGVDLWRDYCSVREAVIMKREQMEAIAAKAEQLAISTLDVEDKQFWAEMELDLYREYLDQLRTGDNQWLRSWIGQEIAEGSREAVEIMKMWIRSELPVAA